MLPLLIAAVFFAVALLFDAWAGRSSPAALHELGGWQASVLVAVVAVFGIALYVSLQRLHARGRATRNAVAGAAGGLLWILGVVGVVLAMIDVLPGSSLLLKLELAFITLLGSLVCMPAAVAGGPAVRVPSPFVALAALVLAIVTFGGVSCFRAAVAVPPLSVEQARTWAAAFDRPLEKSPAWRHLAIVVAGLRAAAGDAETEIDLGRAEAVVADALDRAFVDGEKYLYDLPRKKARELSPFSLVSALDAGVATDRILAVSPPQNPERYESPAHFVEQAALPIRAMLHTGLPPERRAAIAHALVEVWPKPDSHDVLRKMAVIVGLLDALGHPEIADGLRPDVHEALRMTWCGAEDEPVFAASAAFTIGQHAPYLVDEPCSRAAELMARMGVPGDLPNLHLFDDWLRDASRPVHNEEDYRVVLGSLSWFVDRNVTLPETPPVRWWAFLVTAQLGIAVLALTLFCIAAAWNAPMAPTGQRSD